MLSILDAYEKATTRRLIVSAFKQAGVRYMIPDPQLPERTVAYVDPTEARAVKNNVIVIPGLRPVDRPPRGQIRVSDLILNPQRREDSGGGRGEARAEDPANGRVLGTPQRPQEPSRAPARHTVLRLMAPTRPQDHPEASPRNARQPPDAQPARNAALRLMPPTRHQAIPEASPLLQPNTATDTSCRQAN